MTEALYRPSTIPESFCLFTALATLGVVRYFTFSHVSVYVVVSHYGFNLHLPDGVEQFSYTH